MRNRIARSSLYSPVYQVRERIPISSVTFPIFRSSVWTSYGKRWASPPARDRSEYWMPHEQRPVLYYAPGNRLYGTLQTSVVNYEKSVFASRTIIEHGFE